MRTEAQIKELLNEMSLKEKIALLSGKDFWHLVGFEKYGLDQIMVTDGPHGIRKQPEEVDQLGIGGSLPATCFPTAVTMASSWDRSLLQEVGKALGNECRKENVGVLLGPGLNIKRSPLCGRNFEYYSEDPYLSGHMAASFVNGVQSKGVGTCMKHFAANNEEYFRFVIDTIVDERTFREIYLTAFEILVKEAQPWSAMCSYNRIDGVHSSDNHRLLTEILRDEWGFEGAVMTDWGAMNDRLEGVRAGLDLEMPGSNGLNDDKVSAAVASGELSEADVDKVAGRVITLIEKIMAGRTEQVTVDYKAHHALAQSVAEQSMVLLKNQENALPLNKDEKIAVIGDMAMNVRIQGTGSSQINPTYKDIPYDSICKIAGGQLPYAQGYIQKSDTLDSSLVQDAVKVAQHVETVVLFIGLTKVFESEGFDRDHLSIPNNQLALIDAIVKTGKKIVVVLTNGSPVEMPWVANVDALLEGYLGGQAGGTAIANILFGNVNPSGKIAETFPHKLTDDAVHNYFPGDPAQVQYREGLYVGYRFFDTVKKEVLFPFGFGLSYTSFSYSDIEVSQDSFSDNDTVTVSCTITNSGAVAGAEVVQLYVRDKESSHYSPEKELKEFAKVVLKPGESKKVEFTLDKRSFAFYDVASSDWQVESGEFDICIGASSQEILLTKTVSIDSSFESVGNYSSALSEYNSPKIEDFTISDDAFAALLGKEIPKKWNTFPFHKNSTPHDLRKSLLGRRYVKRLEKEMRKNFKENDDPAVTMMFMRMMEEMPVRGNVLLGGGQHLNFTMLDGILQFVNGKVFRGIRTLKRGAKELKNHPVK